LNIEWDERKRCANIRKHKLDFHDAILVLGDDHLLLDGRSVGDEIRFRAIGFVRENLVAVIYTERGDAIRVISMRKARDDERRAYQAHFG
jgi:uncharacterized protein